MKSFIQPNILILFEVYLLTLYSLPGGEGGGGSKEGNLRSSSATVRGLTQRSKGVRDTGRLVQEKMWGTVCGVR